MEGAQGGPKNRGMHPPFYFILYGLRLQGSFYKSVILLQCRNGFAEMLVSLILFGFFCPGDGFSRTAGRVEGDVQL